MKVIIIDWAFEKGIVAEGEWDGKLHDKEYAKINGELYNTHTMYIDKPEVRQFVNEIIIEKKRLENIAHDYFFQSINEINKRGYVARKQNSPR